MPDWPNMTNLQPRDYTCGHCSRSVCPVKGTTTGQFRVGRGDNQVQDEWHIYVCYKCGRPTFFQRHGQTQIPGAPFGKSIDDLPEEVEPLYEEIRKCMSIGAYSAAVLCCRKLLMHIAVHKGAEANKGFMCYVDYICENVVLEASKPWVKQIRNKSCNENHQIIHADKADAEELVRLVQMLLTLVYEHEALAESYKKVDP